jgi:hypothetical protein
MIESERIKMADTLKMTLLTISRVDGRFSELSIAEEDTKMDIEAMPATMILTEELTATIIEATADNPDKEMIPVITMAISLT